MSIQDGRLLFFFFFLFQFNTLQQRVSRSSQFNTRSRVVCELEREMPFDHAYAAGGLRHCIRHPNGRSVGLHRHAGTYICHTDTLLPTCRYKNDDDTVRWMELDGTTHHDVTIGYRYLFFQKYISHREKNINVRFGREFVLKMEGTLSRVTLSLFYKPCTVHSVV